MDQNNNNQDNDELVDDLAGELVPPRHNVDRRHNHLSYVEVVELLMIVCHVISYTFNSIETFRLFANSLYSDKFKEISSARDFDMCLWLPSMLIFMPHILVKMYYPQAHHNIHGFFLTLLLIHVVLHLITEIFGDINIL